MTTDKKPDMQEETHAPTAIPTVDGKGVAHPVGLGAKMSDEKDKKEGGMGSVMAAKPQTTGMAGLPIGNGGNPRVGGKSIPGKSNTNADGSPAIAPIKKAEFTIRPGHPEDSMKKVASAMERDGKFEPKRNGKFEPAKHP